MVYCGLQDRCLFFLGILGNFFKCIIAGCGRKRSNFPPLSGATFQNEVLDESLGSLLELSAEPAIEDLSRQIMSEAKLWEAIQEANMELNRRRMEYSAETVNSAEDVPPRSAAGNCALPPCYI